MLIVIWPELYLLLNMPKRQTKQYPLFVVETVNKDNSYKYSNRSICSSSGCLWTNVNVFFLELMCWSCGSLWDGLMVYYTIIIKSSRFTQPGIVVMKKFRKQNEQVYISFSEYHMISIWQFDCRNNIQRLSMYLNIFHTYTLTLFFTKSGEFELWICYISVIWNCIVLLSDLVLYICNIFNW